MRLRIEGGRPIYCQIGEHDVEVVAISPAMPNYPPMACIPCLRALGRWCVKHGQVHQGFADGTSACRKCIDEAINLNLAAGQALLRELESNPQVSSEERKELQDWLEGVTRIMHQSRSRCFTRALAAQALRTKTPIEVVIQKLWRAHSIASILPWPFGEAGYPFGQPPKDECDI